MGDKKNTVIIGIDSSIACSAISLQFYENAKLAKSATMSFPIKKPFGEIRGTRHRKIIDFLLSTVVTYVSDVDLGNTNLILVMEHFAMAAKGRVCDLAELIGMIKMPLILRFNFDAVYEVPPTTLKKFTTGYGFADKASMADHIEQQYGKKFKDDNQVDAFALAALADFVFHRKEEGSRDHKKIIKKITIF